MPHPYALQHQNFTHFTHTHTLTHSHTHRGTGRDHYTTVITSRHSVTHHSNLVMSEWPVPTNLFWMCSQLLLMENLSAACGTQQEWVSEWVNEWVSEYWSEQGSWYILTWSWGYIVVQCCALKRPLTIFYISEWVSEWVVWGGSGLAEENWEEQNNTWSIQSVKQIVKSESTATPPTEWVSEWVSGGPQKKQQQPHQPKDRVIGEPPLPISTANGLPLIYTDSGFKSIIDVCSM
jgi:hypothetical protein